MKPISGAQKNYPLDEFKPYQHKKSQVAAAALGRELSGFVWAIGQVVKPRALQPDGAKP